MFKNNITFSFACFTATEFGPTVIESGGQAYIGFKSEIGALTKVSKNSGHNKQVRNTYEYVSKIILTTTIAECVYKFIYDFQTAEICKQWFSLMLEKRLMDFFDMSAAQILKNYRYKMDEGTWAKHKGELQIYQLNILNNVQKEMVCLGDMNYISMLGFYLRESIPAEIVSRIKATEFQDAEYGRKFHKHLNSYLEI